MRIDSTTSQETPLQEQEALESSSPLDASTASAISDAEPLTALSTDPAVTSAAPQGAFERLLAEQVAHQTVRSADPLGLADTAAALGLDEAQRAFLARIPSQVPEPGAPADTKSISPADAQAFFASLTPEQQEIFAERHPSIVGGMDGAPHELRYEANKVLIGESIDELRKEIGDAKTWIRRLSGRQFKSSADRQIIANRQVLIDRLEGKIEQREAWLEPERQILLFDGTGDGRMAEVKGDLNTAEYATVIVPGIWNDLDNYEKGLQNKAVNVQAASARLGEASGREPATISWLGYDTPDLLVPEAVTKGDARPAAEALPDFVEGLRLTMPNDQHTTVIGHSYGSLVTGLAGGQGLEADTITFVGSPGVGAKTADRLGFAEGTEVYAAQTRGDIINLTPSWIHGPDPSDAAFGADSFETGDARGHSGYFDWGTDSLENLATLALDLEGQP